MSARRCYNTLCDNAPVFLCGCTLCSSEHEIHLQNAPGCWYHHALLAMKGWFQVNKCCHVAQTTPIHENMTELEAVAYDAVLLAGLEILPATPQEALTCQTKLSD